MVFGLGTHARESARASTLAELYADSALYRSSERLLPPSERQPHVLRFELTQGCSHGICTYCSGFDHLPFVAKPVDEYRAHVEAVMSAVGHGSNLAYDLRRVFIGGGNALAVETEHLREAIHITVTAFARRYGAQRNVAPPTRLALYGTTRDIITHGSRGLGKLYCDTGEFTGLTMIYWGLESGSNRVLKFVKKGDSKKRILQAAHIMNDELPIKTSVMIMPGLGGKEMGDEHVRDTAEVLGAISPTFITFLGINAPGSEYDRRMTDEGLTPLAPHEKAMQMIRIIDEMRPAYPISIGCFDTSVDKVGDNPLPFGSVRLMSPHHKASVVGELTVMYKQRFGTRR